MQEINRLKRKHQRVASSIWNSDKEGSVEVAKQIASLIRKKATQDRPVILGLATGNTPILVYKELVRLHNEENLSFRNVITFNLDEYFPIQPGDKNSYVRFMHENLFDHIDIPQENINIPDGTLDKEDVVDFCRSYENKIESLGGIDVQILGIGRNGHIGFNEPGSGIFSLTRRIALDHLTIQDAAANFRGAANVPRKAITMGISTILKAKRVYILGWGDNKADIIRQAIEGEVTDEIPASFLQYHSNVEYILDNESASKLAISAMPWLVNSIEWNDRLIRKATTWLCQTLNKPILKLTDSDYISHGMKSLIEEFGSSYKVNIRIFNELQHTITGWPGGKPNSDDTNRPVPSTPSKKRICVFSPHPDDDVISMGGTFIRLASQGHDLNVAYQVSGNIAVSDEDVLAYAKFFDLFNKEFKTGSKMVDKLNPLVKLINDRKDGEPDSPEALAVKSVIRQVEAISASKFVGVPEEKVTFLDLPFYKTGKVEKNPIGDDDVKIIADYLREIKPHQIYAAADLADPHGTHSVCFDGIIKALRLLEGEEWLEDCVLWGYRGAWAEWPIDEVDMAVPLSPDELRGKIKAIYYHASQKDNVLFPGEDKREFWERARDRNNATAKLYDDLGLAEYEAMELFAKYDYRK